ncbi:hypothetical protein KDL01_16220 [Actinospica durhamensis]|uniref:DUF3558 domain-containing protein n=1 Tax=Actinospica durhamensis TaxID=1508375 RepID=A0A941ISE9_9ACTN|nr:hypothetical protein [Actinospica durhamensis]MBR7834823.1 hypothetical protein [Actinospica durhamensis]
MTNWPQAALAAAVLATACACGSAGQSGGKAPTGPAATDVSSKSHTPAFISVSTGCVLSAKTVAHLSGRDVSQAQSIQMNLTASANEARGCMYTGTAQGTTVLVAIGLEPTRAGATAVQYLAENKLAQDKDMLLTQRDVPGLGSAAQVGSTTLEGETIDVVSLVQIQASTVADISVTVSGSSVSEDASIALARAVLAAVYH